MYSRPYKSQNSGAVKAFEDAYAKEEFLRRSSMAGQGGSTCVPLSAEKGSTSISCGEGCATSKDRDSCSEKTPPDAFRKPKNGFSGLFGDDDGGDMILLFLIALFLLDKDAENDRIIPILLAVLLLF